MNLNINFLLLALKKQLMVNKSRIKTRNQEPKIEK